MNTTIQPLQNLSAPLGRILLSLIFVMSGVNKLFQYEGTQGYMEAMGVPGALLPLVIFVEVIGGLAVILGYHARLAALGLAGFSGISALLFHNDFSNPSEMAHFMKNIALSGSFLLILSQGSGAFSLDNRKSS